MVTWFRSRTPASPLSNPGSSTDHSPSPFVLHPAESAFSRRVEGKVQNNLEETNSSSQNSSGKCAHSLLLVFMISRAGKKLNETVIKVILYFAGRVLKVFNYSVFSLVSPQGLCHLTACLDCDKSVYDSNAFKIGNKGPDTEGLFNVAGGSLR